MATARKTTKTAPVEHTEAPLTPLELHALVRASKNAAEKSRDELELGEGQAVDVTLRVHGAMGVAGRVPCETIDKPDLLVLLVFVLERAGPKRAKELLAAAEADYLKSARPTADEIVSQEMLPARECLERLTVRTPGSKRGNVSGSVQVDVLARGA